MVLHIANGSIMKSYLANKCPAGQELIAFNESMITGECCEEIFSEAFFQQRAETLQVTYERYAELTIAELDKLLNHSYSGITLWFDADMFCQMNVLTLCAYLDAAGYQGSVQLHIICQDFWQYGNVQDTIRKSYQINPRGYYAIYREVLLQKQPVIQEYPVFPELNDGIRRYKDYLSPQGEIRLAIATMGRENRNKQYIIKAINERYPDYGIGDYNIQLFIRS
ncbi:MAG: hypothetical protein K0R22_1248 [Sporomusa sp.]|nr:hypothetical protein [Sporomusa sp.]